MSGVKAAASAIVGAGRFDSGFPAEGVVTSLVVTRDSAGRIQSVALDVSVQDEVLDACGWSGAFGLEIAATTDNGRSLVGRRVRVEVSGGQFLVAYTVNGSGIV